MYKNSAGFMEPKSNSNNSKREWYGVIVGTNLVGSYEHREDALAALEADLDSYSKYGFVMRLTDSAVWSDGQVDWDGEIE